MEIQRLQRRLRGILRDIEMWVKILRYKETQRNTVRRKKWEI